MRVRRTVLPSLPWRLWCLLSTLCLLLVTTGVRADEEFLDPELAFKLDSRALDDRTVEIRFTIAPGYYLYREQFKFEAEGALLGQPVIPSGKTKFDETFQKTVETYRDEVRIALPVRQAAGSLLLRVTNQGCADKGLCYPPQQRAVRFNARAFGGDGSAQVVGADGRVVRHTGLAPGLRPSSAATGDPVYSSDDISIDRALRGGRFWTVVGVFFVAGLLLSLTPCVLPMLPILSSIIVGEGAGVSRGRGFALAAGYSLGMAVVYTGLGIGAGLAGEGLAATLQNGWVLALFAALLVTLALSMFGVYELQLPSTLTSRLSATSQRLPAGRFAGVFVMGGLSALIVSPCVAAPLAGALVYLSQTKDVVLGGSALFSLAAGMSVPLLLIGASAGTLLPRAGAWMNDVKRFFGILLLGVALWTLQSIVNPSLALALWGVLAWLAAGIVLGVGRRRSSGTRASSGWRRTAAAGLALLGIFQWVGAASGGSDPLRPLSHLRQGGDLEVDAAAPMFTTVRTTAELDAVLRNAGKPVMLDFYADWCVSCKEMERFTFADPAVRLKLRGAVLLKADVTANNADDKELLKRFNLFGPPGTIFFDDGGRELHRVRVAGFQTGTRFIETLTAAGL